MIEKMLKAYCVARSRDRDRLLDGLAELGVIHLKPVDPATAVADEEIVSALERLRRAVQILGGVAPAGEAPELDPLEAADQVLAIQRASTERRNRLATLHRQLEALRLWGDVRLEQLQALREAGIEIRFFVVPEGAVDQVEAECVERVGTYPGRRAVVAVVSRTGEPKLPEEAEELAIPRRDRPSIREEAAQIDRALAEDAKKLSALANLIPSLERKIEEFEEKAAYSVAVRGALAAEELFAVQGWVPVSKADSLLEGLARFGVEAAVQCFDPPPEEEPPTLVRYPKWTRPIKALFDILNTVPGYREFDLSPFFMIAIPLFAAIIIGDAGYGLVFALGGLLYLKKAKAGGAKEKAQLLVVLGVVTMLWGLITGGFFGLGPINFVQAGGLLAQLGYLWNRITVVGVSTAEIARAVASGDTQEIAKLSDQAMTSLRIGLIEVSFIIAVVHLVAARLREAAGLWPDQRAVASVGWALVLVGIFGVVWFLFFGQGGTLAPGWVYLVLAGWILAVLFSAPSPNPLKRIGLGVAACLLPVMDCFSNTMSYIRLMAVSLASVYIAQVFNMLAGMLADSATWFAAAPIVVFGHALNIGLCVIAIFAHGVRLNMLEFSSNAGVQWAGYPFRPFTKSRVKES